MITTTQCFEAHCDVCSRGYGGFYDDPDENDTVHYATRDALERSLASSEWAVTGQRLLCPECQRDAACELIGHQWEDWEPVDVESYTGRRRDCEHCNRSEYDPPVRTTTDQPADNS